MSIDPDNKLNTKKLKNLHGCFLLHGMINHGLSINGIFLPTKIQKWPNSWHFHRYN